MKRTGLRRKTALTARQPMRRKSPRKREASPKPRKADPRFRSDEYLSFVRSLPCCVCQKPANAAHHLKGIWHASGASLKAPDSLAMPVCDGPLSNGCHARIHSESTLRWMQPIFLIETINAGLERYTEGKIHDALIEARDFVISKQEVGA